MGWSCRREAGIVEDAWSRACIASTGMQNVWLDNGKRYFYETSRTEHRDGAITGKIIVYVDDTHCKTAGSFRIEGDGTITRAPKFLKHAAKDAAICVVTERRLTATKDWIADTYETTWSQSETSAEALEASIVKYLKSFEIGGCNQHISKSLGHIPVVTEAKLVHVPTGNVITTWKAPMFWVV